jgi:hypothetical protein
VEETGIAANRNAKMPEVNPGMWNQGVFRANPYWPGVGSDLSRIGESVKVSSDNRRASKKS